MFAQPDSNDKAMEPSWCRPLSLDWRLPGRSIHPPCWTVMEDIEATNDDDYIVGTLLNLIDKYARQ